MGDFIHRASSSRDSATQRRALVLKIIVLGHVVSPDIRPSDKKKKPTLIQTRAHYYIL